ncbi:hypothetical protein [Terricaulis sp.]|jgi:hypothetical protein|nr:hypothetical protein [Terricaulis sp.]MDZ4691933.1 hypothetical protein [Terricaulis sp.]
MMNIPADRIAKRTSAENVLVRSSVITLVRTHYPAHMPPPGDRIAVRS